MSIVVFYLSNSSPEGQTPAWQPRCQPFDDAQMGEAPVSYTHLTLPTKA